MGLLIKPKKTPCDMVKSHHSLREHITENSLRKLRIHVCYCEKCGMELWRHEYQIEERG